MAGKRKQEPKQRVVTWEAMPPAERPRMLPLFPDGTRHFRRWPSLRWFLLLMAPILASAAAVLVRGEGLLPAAVVLVIGSAVAVVLFDVVTTGRSSSNCGTYYRRTEPWRFWLSVGVIALGYLLLSTAGYFLQGKSADPPANRRVTQEAPP